MCESRINALPYAFGSNGALGAVGGDRVCHCASRPLFCLGRLGQRVNQTDSDRDFRNVTKATPRESHHARDHGALQLLQVPDQSRVSLKSLYHLGSAVTATAHRPPGFRAHRRIEIDHSAPYYASIQFTQHAPDQSRVSHIHTAQSRRRRLKAGCSQHTKCISTAGPGGIAPQTVATDNGAQLLRREARPHWDTDSPRQTLAPTARTQSRL